MPATAPPMRYLLLFLCLVLAVPAAAEEALRVWTSDPLGFQVRYPQGLWLVDDPKVTGRVLTRVGEFIDLGEAEIGLQFFLFCYEPGQVRVNPNLNLCTVRMTEQEREMAPDALAAEVFANVPRLIPGARQVEETRPVEIGGRTFYTAVFDFTQQGVDFRCREYFTPVADRGLAYTLAVTDEVAQFEKHAPVLEGVVQTVEIH